MVGKLDEAFRFQETALSLRAQRQQLIASNIANADTPNYKARDIDFNSALQNAMTKGTPAAAAPMAKTAATHLNGANPNATANGIPLLYRTPATGTADGNTVDMDAERNQFTDNAVRYEASLTLINAQIRNMLTALQGS
ncbi:flagellar basal body rod protein FlgB [Oxalobacteraceae bacterium OM1]|nr:flagellar basal body rod protein FlgB [Oxalobacteraceae bacterium OM1]